MRRLENKHLNTPTSLSSFRNFDVAESRSCVSDWLLLTPAGAGESRLCASVLPPPFISSRGHVWLYFHSQANSSGQAQGFRLSYIRGELNGVNDDAAEWRAKVM